MLNRKGFTLVEILAVIVIIGLIMSLIVPVAIGIIQDTKQKAYEMQVSSIEEAASGYISEYATTITELAPTGGTYTIILRDLVDDGLIDEPIKNPLTNQNMDLDNTSVLVTKLGNGTYSYVVSVN